MEGFERFFLVLEFVFNGGEISLRRRWEGLKLVKYGGCNLVARTKWR